MRHVDSIDRTPSQLPVGSDLVPSFRRRRCWLPQTNFRQRLCWSDSARSARWLVNGEALEKYGDGLIPFNTYKSHFKGDEHLFWCELQNTIGVQGFDASPYQDLAFLLVFDLFLWDSASDIRQMNTENNKGDDTLRAKVEDQIGQ